jgi:outer membrane receptor protein involved in Fe transport
MNGLLAEPRFRRLLILAGTAALIALPAIQPVRAQSQSSDIGYDLVPLSSDEYADILQVQGEEELPPIEPLEEPALDGDLDEDLDSLLNMDVDRLSNVAVRDISTQDSQINISTGTLTATTSDSVSPATVTHISPQMIEKSGARNLNELLDIFVPNLQVIRHHAYYSHIGIRGINSDREDKYLLRVNGRVMNHRFVVGADSERDLPLLKDIASVDVIRGAGSSTYGAGAIAGVISITTFNGLTFEGLDATARHGIGQEQTTTEVRWGKRLGDETGIFSYFGYADQNGAQASDSPLVYGRSGALPNQYPAAVAGDPAPFGYPDDEILRDDGPKYKAHFQFTHGTFDFWTRYTRGGYMNINQMRNMYRPPIGTSAANSSLESRPGTAGDYQQLTYFASKVFEMTDYFNVSTIASYDFYDFVESRFNAATTILPSREEELYFRIMGQYTPEERHALAFGYEHSREMFGLDTPLTNSPTRGQRLGLITNPWDTNTGSIFAEYRFDITDSLTSVFSTRWDKHTYSNYLFSPRLGLMYECSDIDLLKFSMGQSVRKAGDEELRAQWIANGTIADEEILEGSEIRWERRPTDNLLLASSVFHQIHDVVGFSGSISRSVLLGTFESWGWELEAVYDLGDTYLTASHGYVKLMDGTLVDPNLIQGISAAPYGFGDDFANWSNHISKIAIAKDIAEGTNVSTSLRVYYGFDGGRDLADYNRTLATPSGSISQADPGYNKSFRGNYFLDFGLQREWTEHITWRVDLYNVLGWWDINLNKRNYINRVDTYRPEAATVGLSAIVAY